MLHSDLATGEVRRGAILAMARKSWKENPTQGKVAFRRSGTGRVFAVGAAMNVLIVFAHPERHSFNGTMLDAATRTLATAGHTVVVSDLYRMGFASTLDRHDFLDVADPDRFNAQKEQSEAFRTGRFAPELKAEMDKIDACDLMIWQFPIYWFSVPAILKGWIDRVFAFRYAYGGGRWYEKGVFAGKKALILRDRAY